MGNGAQYEHTIYVGLYNSGGGIVDKYTHNCQFHNTGSIEISNALTLTLESDLSGANPQFTLTCISIGGPATTVTWTRDSHRINSYCIKINNATTAQYTHTLTVTGRLGGLYTYTAVANNTPSENSTSLTVQSII